MLQIEIGHRIRHVRIARGWEQKVIAKELGVSTNTVSTWETGQRSIPIDKFGQLATLLGVGWSYLGEADMRGLPDWLREPVAQVKKNNSH